MDVPESDPQFKVPVVRRPDYTLLLEQAAPTHTFIHCDIHSRWSPQIKVALAEDFAALKLLHGGPLYAVHNPADHKHLKFLALYGFEFVASYQDDHDCRMDIFSTH